MEWRPIETAPKDGRWLKLKTVQGEETRGFWTGAMAYDGCGYSGWTDGSEHSEQDYQDGYSESQGYMEIDGVTHWMPILDAHQ